MQEDAERMFDAEECSPSSPGVVSMEKKRVVIDSERCDFCGTCVAVCPEDAIELKRTTVIIDDELCTSCRLCIDICPLAIPVLES
jgi:ferredoxin